MAKSRAKPMMITPDRAAAYVLRCLERRPLQLSVPKLVGVVAHSMRLGQSLRVWLG
jgi:hypothetical protein